MEGFPSPDQRNADFTSLHVEQRFEIGTPKVLEMATRNTREY